MMDESVQMSLVHFIATRRPNRNGWDKEVFALKKAWRSSPLEVSICNIPCRPCFKTMVGDYGVAAAQTCQPGTPRRSRPRDFNPATPEKQLPDCDEEQLKEFFSLGSDLESFRMVRDRTI